MRYVFKLSKTEVRMVRRPPLFRREALHPER